MNRPERYLKRMGFFVGAVAVLFVLLFGPLKAAFLANPALNGVILVTLLIGIAFVFRQVLTLRPEIEWVEAYRAGPGAAPVADEEPGTAPEESPQPVLLAPMAAMLGERGTGVRLSTLSMRSLLDSIGARLDEGREISRYLVGLLIFLGLLGTFWGLLGTISAIGETIRSLSVATTDLALMFDDLKRGLEAPMGGMATAFSSSLFGLAGSVILGFLDLQAGQAQSRFYNDLEEWLSTVSELSLAAPGGLEAAGPGASSYVAALLEQSADSLDKLEGVVARSEDGRNEMRHALLRLSEQLAGLADQMQAGHKLMGEMAEGQQKLGAAVAAVAEGAAGPGGGLDDATKTHLRNIDVHLKSLLDEQAKGRREATEALRQEIKLLARTLAKALDRGSGEAGLGDVGGTLGGNRP